MQEFPLSEELKFIQLGHGFELRPDGSLGNIYADLAEKKGVEVPRGTYDAGLRKAFYDRLSGIRNGFVPYEIPARGGGTEICGEIYVVTALAIANALALPTNELYAAIDAGIEKRQKDVADWVSEVSLDELTKKRIKLRKQKSEEVFPIGRK
ncbi:MAG: hypothetical protein HY368_02745 [Candidatus Aenigmarchaeota archaeon]|nr:hypothetical protein [Candidatus Aenigmarchaeota archaeon]